MKNSDSFTPGSWPEVTRLTGWSPGRTTAKTVSLPLTDEAFRQECIRKYEEFKRIGEQAKKNNYKKFGGFDR